MEQYKNFFLHKCVVFILHFCLCSIPVITQFVGGSHRVMFHNSYVGHIYYNDNLPEMPNRENDLVICKLIEIIQKKIESIDFI